MGLKGATLLAKEKRQSWFSYVIAKLCSVGDTIFRLHTQPKEFNNFYLQRCVLLAKYSIDLPLANNFDRIAKK